MSLIALIFIIALRVVTGIKCLNNVWSYGDKFYCIDSSCELPTFKCANLKPLDKCTPVCGGTRIGSGPEVYDQNVICGDYYFSDALCESNVSNKTYIYYGVIGVGALFVLIAVCYCVNQSNAKKEIKEEKVYLNYVPPVCVPIPSSTSAPEPFFDLEVYRKLRTIEKTKDKCAYLNSVKNLYIKEYTTGKITNETLKLKLKFVDLTLEYDV